MAKRAIKAHIKDVKNTAALIAGGNIGKNVKPGTFLGSEGGDVHIEMERVEGGKLEVAGGNIISYSRIAESLDNLAQLLSQHLIHQDQKNDLQEIVAELKEQIKKSESERSPSKIKRLLNSIGTYLGLATLATTKMEQAKALYETLRGLLE